MDNIRYVNQKLSIFCLSLKPLRKELFTLDEIDTIREQYGIKQVIITHLEEDWGKSYDDYKELEEKLNFIHFAYDGLKI